MSRKFSMQFISLLIFLCFFFKAFVSAMELDKLFEANTRSVVRIVVSGELMDGSSDRFRGTGFFIDKHGHFLTAAHVVAPEEGWKPTLAGSRKNPKIEVYQVVDTEGKFKKVESDPVLLFADHQTDLALLRLRVTPETWVKIGNSVSIKTGKEVGIIAAGATTGGSATPTKGTIGDTFHINFSGLMQVNDSAIQQGDSGAPIFNDGGEVVAIVTEGLKGRGNAVFGTPINLSANLLDMAGITLSYNTQELLDQIIADVKNLSPEQLNQRIKEIEDAIDLLRKKIDWKVNLVKKGYICKLSVEYDKMLAGGSHPSKIDVDITPYGLRKVSNKRDEVVRMDKIHKTLWGTHSDAKGVFEVAGIESDIYGQFEKFGVYKVNRLHFEITSVLNDKEKTRMDVMSKEYDDYEFAPPQ